MPDDLLNRPPLTRTQLVDQLDALRVRSGDTVMLHCRMSSLGFVIGAADIIVTALLELLGPSGTLVAMTGWEHDAYHLDQWPERVRNAYRNDPPAFDPELSEAASDYGRLAERIRTWPGARHSSHPECRFSAIGARAEWITADQPRDHAYGPGSPLARLVEAEGSVLMLGAPLDTVTLLHYAEELARVPNKKIVHYSCPIKTPGGIDWVDIEDIDTSEGALPYQRVIGDRDSFQVIAEEALAAGIGREGKVGEARSVLFPAAGLADFGVAWIEERFA